MTLLTSYFYPLDWGPSRSKQVSGGKEAEMTERDAAEAIFQKLCEKFKLDGEREYENAFTLGGDLGFTEDEKFETLCGFLGRTVNAVSK